MSKLSPSKEIKDLNDKLLVIITNIRDIIIESDLNGIFTYVSPQVFDILGYKPEEVIGLNGFKFIHPDDLPKLADILANLITTGGPITAEYRAMHKDGHYVYLSARGTVVKENGNTKLIAVLRDISLQKETEEKYRFITENINDIISVLNDKLELLFINETQERISGFSKEEVMGKSPIEFMHPDDIKVASAIIMKTLKEGQGRGKFRMRKKDNSYNWMDVNGRVTFDSEGNQRILLVSRDIAREKEIELKLEETEQNYKLLAKNINDIIWTMDLNFKTNYVTPSIKPILGYTVEEDMARSISDKFTPESLEIIREMIKTHITPKKIKDKNYNPVFRIEVDHYHKDGSIIPCEVTINPMRDENGIAFGLVGITRNIAERKEAEQKLKISEQKYRLISENANDLITVIKPDLEIDYMNADAHLRVLGYSEEEYLGKKRIDLIHPDDLERVIKTYKELYDIGEGSIEFRIRKKDGKYIWVHLTGKNFNDNIGIKKTILTSRDITEKKIAEEALRESEEKYRTLFENSPHAVGLINPKGIVIQGNSNIEKIFGYKLEEIIGQNFSKFPLFSKEDNVIILNSLTKLLKGETPEPQELQLRRKDGTIIWASMQASIVKMKNDTLFQVITQDISKIKEAEKQLEEKNKELQKLNELKTEFLRRASHELKTPLVAIKGNADLVLKLHYDNLTSDVITKLDAIQKGCDRLGDIVYKLIETSKLETSEIVLQTKKEDLTSLFKLCVNELQPLIKMRNLTVNVNLKDIVTAEINKDQIQEVISNLLSNSIYYSPPNSVINLNSEINDNFIIISIKDNGIGFTEDEKLKIFQKFGRIKRTSRDFDIISEGSGLGLYITKKIVEFHGGKIWVESEGRNKGSTVYFTLPII